MDDKTATEVAYKNGYRDAIKKFAEYLKKHSFECDCNVFLFDAINVDDLDELVEDFLNGR